MTFTYRDIIAAAAVYSVGAILYRLVVGASISSSATWENTLDCVWGAWCVVFTLGFLPSLFSRGSAQ